MSGVPARGGVFTLIVVVNSPIAAIPPLDCAEPVAITLPLRLTNRIPIVPSKPVPMPVTVNARPTRSPLAGCRTWMSLRIPIAASRVVCARQGSSVGVG